MPINYKKIRLLFIIVASISLFCVWQNNDLVINQIDYINTKIPAEFSGYKIVQVSDLHNKEFGRDQERLIKRIKEISPDIIVVTGDLIDRRKYDLDTAIVFIKGAKKIAPVYYVSGNHEAWSGDYANISHWLLNSGAQIIDDRKIDLIQGEAKIEILGLSDPDFLTSSYLEKTKLSKLKENLNLLSDNSVFQILLSHRPEPFELYAEGNIELIFSGHAHGGQFRIPFIGGIIAPDQGFFPKYTGGAYILNQSTLIVSRGLGNSIIPIRIFNRPEIVAVTLQNGKHVE